MNNDEMKPLPEGWKWARLGEVADFIRGVTFDKSDASPFPSEGAVPILRAGNIQRSLDIQNDLVWIPKGNMSDDQLLRKGDIAICMS